MGGVLQGRSRVIASRVVVGIWSNSDNFSLEVFLIRAQNRKGKYNLLNKKDRLYYNKKKKIRTGQVTHTYRSHSFSQYTLLRKNSYS